MTKRHSKSVTKASYLIFQQIKNLYDSDRPHFDSFFLKKIGYSKIRQIANSIESSSMKANSKTIYLLLPSILSCHVKI